MLKINMSTEYCKYLGEDEYLGEDSKERKLLRPRNTDDGERKGIFGIQK
jgi:hypothetical protein